MADGTGPLSLADAMRQASAVAPKLATGAPGITIAFANQAAQTGSPVDTQSLTAIAGFHEALSLEQSMLSQDADVQIKRYAALPADQKALLSQVGYQLPAQEHHSSSVWGSISHAITHGGGDVLNALGAGQRFVQHEYRAMDVASGVTGLDKPGLLGQFANLASPSKWRAAWSETSDGQKSYNQRTLQDIARGADPAEYDLAKRLSDGETVDDIANFDPSKYQALHDLAAKPGFNDLLQKIGDAHLSFGRDMVRSLGIKNEPSLNLPGIGVKFHPISGLLDGVVDFTTDPLLLGGKAATTIKVARFGLAGANSERVATLFQNSRVAGAWDGIGKNLDRIRNGTTAEKGSAYADILDRHPSAQPLIQPMLDDGVHDSTSARDWMMNADNLTKTLSGQAAREAPLMPRTLSPFGEALIRSKQFGRSVIDYTTLGGRVLADADTLDPIIGKTVLESRQGIAGAPRRLGLIGRRMFTRVPLVRAFNVNDPSALDNMRRLGLTYLPASHVNRLVASFASSDLAGKRQIYKGMLSQVAEASGITRSETGREWFGRFVDDLDEWSKVRAYSTVEGAGQRMTDAGVRDLGLVESHLTETWGIPSFRDMYAQAARIGILDRMGAQVTRPFMDKAMSVWKYGVLTRLGFPIRAGGDEVVAAMMRGRATDYWQARAALSAAGKADLATRPGGVLARTLSKMVPDSLDPKIEDGRSWLRGIITAPAVHALAPAERAAGGEEFWHYAEKLADDPYWQQAIGHQIVHGLRADYETRALDDIANSGTRAVQVRWVSDNAWAERTANGFEGSVRWAHQLNQLELSRPAMKVIEHFGDPTKAIAETKKLILSDSFARERSLAELMRWTKDGRSVASGQATAAEAAHDWASDLYDHVESLLTTTAKDGEGGEAKQVIKPVLDHFRQNYSAPGAGFLNDLKVRPDKVIGKEFSAVAAGEGLISKLAGQGFERIVTRPMNYISRNPLALMNYVQARRILSGVEREMLDKGMGRETVEDIIHRAAVYRGVTHTVEFIHNPQLRTQFSTVARNLFPFRHAEEGFITRWARSLRENPANFHKAQLIFAGAQHMGFIQNDGQGNLVFYYPMSGAMFEVLRRTVNMLNPGADIPDAPFPLRFSSQVRFLSPGTTTGASEHLYPQAGPLIGLGFGLIQRMFKETSHAELARQAEEKAVGPLGAGKPLWQEWVPTAVTRLYQVWGDQRDAGSQLSSATMQALAMLDAGGHTPPANATPAQVDAFLNRWKSWSRTVLMLRAVLGFAVPAVPSSPELSGPSDPEFAASGVKSLTQEFRDLTQHMTYQQALATFVSLHPDGSVFKGGSFLVPTSQVDGGAYAPATQATLDWMTGHTGLIKKYPRAAPYLLPQDPGKFNYDAFREQLALGVRHRLGLEDFYQQLKIQDAERVYFADRDKRDAAIAQAKAAGDTTTVKAIETDWHTRSADFLAVNPLFADWLSKGSERAQTRAETISELTTMLEDPATPKSPATAALGDILGAYQQHVAYQDSLYLNRTSEANAARSAEQTAFFEYVQKSVAANPQLIGLYDNLFRPLEGAN